MADRIQGTVAVTFRPGQMGPDDWHTRVVVGDRDYVAISKWRWLALLRAGTLLRQIVRDLERKPVLPLAGESPSTGSSDG